MPANARILSVQEQGDDPVLWVMVDTNQQHVERVFAIFGTGFPIPDDSDTQYSYLSTVQLRGGQLVLHVFEVLQPSPA